VVVVLEARSDWFPFVVVGASVVDVVVAVVVVTAGAFAHPIKATPMIRTERNGRAFRPVVTGDRT
jgi:hypothetical protein